MRTDGWTEGRGGREGVAASGGLCMVEDVRLVGDAGVRERGEQEEAGLAGPGLHPPRLVLLCRVPAPWFYHRPGQGQQQRYQ